MSYARRHSTNVCPGNRVRYSLNWVAEVPDFGFSLLPESFQFDLAVVRQMEVNLALVESDDGTCFGIGYFIELDDGRPLVPRLHE